MHADPSGVISFVQEENGLAFFGDRDPWIETDTIRELCVSKKLTFRTLPGCNHSLETGRVKEDVENLKNIILETEEYMVNLMDRS